MALSLALGLFGCDGPARTAQAAGAYEEDAAPETMSSFAMRWLFGVGMGRKLHIDRMQLYYVEPVTEQQAHAAGQFLHHLGIGRRDELVQIRKNTDSSPPVYELRLSTPFGAKEHIDRETRTVYQLMALSAEGAVFDGAPVHVYLCNSLLQPLVILRPRLKAQQAQSQAQVEAQAQSQAQP